jgi:hypothetical protein
VKHLRIKNLGAVWLVLVGMALADVPVTEMLPAKDPSVPVGKIAVVEGRVGKAEQRLIVNNLELTQPVQVTLVAENPESKIRLRVARENWDRILRDGNTADGKGSVTFQFRCSKHAAFLVDADEESTYQLMVWVGPKVEWTPTPALTSMKAFEGEKSEEAVKSPGTEGEGFAGVESPEAPDSGNTGLIYALFLTNGIALVAVFFMARKSRQVANVILVVGLASTFCLGPARTETQEPKPLTLKQTWDRTRESVDRLVELSGASTGSSTVDDAVSKANKALILAQALFNYLDPKEAAISPNYTPNGLPALPSRSMDLFKVPPEVAAAQDELEECLRLLETLRSIYVGTIAQTDALEQGMEAAASFSPIGNLYLMAEKTDPNYKAGKRELDRVYDDAYEKLMTKANDALLTIAISERKKFGDFEWYARYGLPYYLFLHNRYQRR